TTLAQPRSTTRTIELAFDDDTGISAQTPDGSISKLVKTSIHIRYEGIVVVNGGSKAVDSVFGAAVDARQYLYHNGMHFNHGDNNAVVNAKAFLGGGGNGRANLRHGGNNAQAITVATS